jgi:hypothetical protein
MSFAEISAELRAWASTIVLPFVNLYILLRNDRRSERRSAAVESKVDIGIKQTDGLSEQLGKLKHKEGLQEGRAEGEAKAATLEEGRQQGRDESKP